MTSPRTRLRRTVAGISAGTVALAGAALTLAGPASAVPGFEFERLSGDNRYETAAAIALDSFADADVVLLANGQSDDPRTAGNESHFPDALAGNYLAGVRSAPTLLTTETDVPEATQAALEEIDPTTVIIIGGTAAVSAEQERELRADFTVERIEGDNRYETAAAVAREPGADNVGSTDGLRTAIVASGVQFPDALVTGPLSYAADLPLTLTTQQRLSPETREVLVELDIERVLIPGGTDAVGAAVQDELEDDLDIAVERFDGDNRVETARLVADFALSDLDFTDTHVNLALGQRFPDALTGGPHAGQDLAPILLTADVDVLGAQTRDFLEDHADTLEDGHIFGGTNAVSARVQAEAEEAAQGEDVSPSPSPTSPNPSPSPGTGSDTATVTITDRSVEAGTAVTGTVTGDDIRSVVVDGCGLRSESVEDTDEDTDGIQFSETIPSVQPAGECTLVFTTTFTDGRTDTDRVMINVTAPPTVTTRPELVEVEQVSTTTNDNGTTDTEDDFQSSRVRFTFDEPVIGKQPVAGRFVLVGFDPANRIAGQSALLEAGGTSVVVTFGRGDDATTETPDEQQDVGTEELAAISLAVVDIDAVLDNQGQANPIGDRPFGESRTDARFAPGFTEAPDLVTVTVATGTVQFRFDEPVLAIVDPTGFHVITADNGDVTCTNPVLDDQTVTATCTSSGDNVVRGYVESDTVSDEEQVDTLPTDSGIEGNLNPLQAAPFQEAGVTDGPDLVSAEFRPGADGADDAVLFTFDEPVFLGNQNRFVVYQEDTDEFTSATATRQGDATQVLATFEAEESVLPGVLDPTPALVNAVGVSVLEGAVIEAGDANRQNQEDELGVLNPATNDVTAGRTEGPDLVSVEIDGSSAIYTFDESLSASATALGDFSLFTSTGTQLVCRVGTTSGDSVTCTGFQSGNAPASGAQVESAVLGTVDDGGAADADGNTSPEGAEVTTGGNGTPED